MTVLCAVCVLCVLDRSIYPPGEVWLRVFCRMCECILEACNLCRMVVGGLCFVWFGVVCVLGKVSVREHVLCLCQHSAEFWTSECTCPEKI